MDKLIEIKGQDWIKGSSVQIGIALGGLFQVAAGFDPFNNVGFLQPSLSPTELDAPATDPIKVITHWNDGTDQYIYAHSASKVYKYLSASPFTRTDVTSQASVSDGSGGTISGGIMWNRRYIYAEGTKTFSNTVPLASASEVEILSNIYASGVQEFPFCIGADKNLYKGDGINIIKFTSETTPAGTYSNYVAFTTELGMKIRALVNDGHYLVAFADNNTVGTTTRTAGNYSCRAYFWDMAKTTADVIWDFPGESYLIGAAMLDGAILVFGYNGIYVCNMTTPPKMILSFLGNATFAGKRPTSCYQIVGTPNAVLWADGNAYGQNVYAYGHLAGSNTNIFYSPYNTHTTTASQTCLSFSAGTVFAGTSTPKLFAHNVGSTGGNATVQIAPIRFSQPIRYGYAKVTLKNKLSSGQAITFSVATAGGSVISDSETKSYSATNPKRTFKFDLKPATGSTSITEDLTFTINPQAGAIVERVAIYGTPLDDADQTL